MAFSRVMEQLARDAPAFNRVIEHRAREIANEAVKRVNQGATEESAAQDVHVEITAHAGGGRWVLRALLNKVIKMMARDAALDVLCDLVRGLFSS